MRSEPALSHHFEHKYTLRVFADLTHPGTNHNFFFELAFAVPLCRESEKYIGSQQTVPSLEFECLS